MSMSKFWSGQFAQDQGSFITAKIRANNSKGNGEMSRWNTSGAVVEKLPAMMNRPTAVRDPATSAINLQWTNLVAPRDGGSPIITYELVFKQSDDSNWQEVVG